ncbi:MAG: AraC family transcriptional regulator [Sinimarinibacterium sp.]|jgi:AraC-like DNA-binding protein
MLSGTSVDPVGRRRATGGLLQTIGLPMMAIMPAPVSPFTNTILPIKVRRLAAHPNVVMAVLAGRTGPIIVEQDGVCVTGDVVLVRPGVVHGVLCGERGADVLYLNGLTFPFEAPLAVPLKGILEQLAHRSLGCDPGASEELRARLAFATGPLPTKIADIVRATQADPMRRVTQNELARYLDMERTRALRCFKAATGLTFRQFKRWSGLQHAAQQMARRTLVRTAAMDAGFADTAHLSRVFRSTFGVSPGMAIAELDHLESE